MKTFSNEKFSNEKLLEKAERQAVQTRKLFPIRKPVEPEMIAPYLEYKKQGFIDAFEGRGTPYTLNGLGFLAKCAAAFQQAVPVPVLWPKPIDFVMEIYSVFLEIEPYVHWNWSANQFLKDVPMGQNIVGFVRVLLIERIIPVQSLLSLGLDYEDMLASIWAEKSGEDLIFCNDELIIYGGKRRELSIETSTKIDGFDFPVWTRSIRRDYDQPFIRPSTFKAARKAVQSYRGYSTHGKLDGDHAIPLVKFLGMKIVEDADGKLAVLERSRGRGFSS